MTPFIGSLLLAYFAAWCGWQAYSRGNHRGGNAGVGGTILSLSLWAIFPAPETAMRTPFVAHLMGTEVHTCQCEYVQVAIKLGEPLRGYNTLAAALRDKKLPHACIHPARALSSTPISAATAIPVSSPNTKYH